MTYFEMLKDPRWQKRRLEIMQRDSFTCRNCNRDDKTLTVHHKIYFKGLPLWDYKDIYLQTLCEDCHLERETFLKVLLCTFQNNDLPTATAEEILDLCACAVANLGRAGFISALRKLSKE